MAMVTVLARRALSGALAIRSYAMHFGLALASPSILMIAAVSVVLPWSMWPMVPTFTCGLVRSNFSFAIAHLRAVLPVRATDLPGPFLWPTCLLAD